MSNGNSEKKKTIGSNTSKLENRLADDRKKNTSVKITENEMKSEKNIKKLSADSSADSKRTGDSLEKTVSPLSSGLLKKSCMPKIKLKGFTPSPKLLRTSTPKTKVSKSTESSIRSPKIHSSDQSKQELKARHPSKLARILPAFSANQTPSPVVPISSSSSAFGSFPLQKIQLVPHGSHLYFQLLKSNQSKSELMSKPPNLVLLSKSKGSGQVVVPGGINTTPVGGRSSLNSFEGGSDISNFVGEADNLSQGEEQENDPSFSSILEPIVTIDVVDENNVSSNNWLENSPPKEVPSKKGTNLPRRQTKTASLKQNTNKKNIMIPTNFLEYCTLVNGKYVISKDDLKKIPNHLKVATTEIEKSFGNITGLGINSNEIIDLCDSTNDLNQTKSKSRSRTKTYSQTSKSRLDRLKKNRKTPANKKSPVKVVETSKIEDKNLCRFSYVKSSRWNSIEHCMIGFNEREIDMSNKCNERLTKLLKNDMDYLADLAYTIPRYIKTKSKISDQRKKSRSSQFKSKIVFRSLARIEEIRECKDHLKSLLLQTKPCKIVIRRHHLTEELITNQLKLKRKKETLRRKVVDNIYDLNINPLKPLIILNFNNFDNFFCTSEICENNNVVYIIKRKEDFHKNLYQDEMLVDFLNKRLLKITNDSVLKQCI